MSLNETKTIQTSVRQVVYWKGSLQHWLKGFLNYGQGRGWKEHFIYDDGLPNDKTRAEFMRKLEQRKSHIEKLRAKVKKEPAVKLEPLSEEEKQLISSSSSASRDDADEVVALDPAQRLANEKIEERQRQHLLLVDMMFGEEEEGEDLPFCFDGEKEKPEWDVERGIAWAYIVKTFPSPYDSLPTKVRRGDICGFVMMLQQKYSKLEPEEVRLEVAWFYVSFIKRSENIEDFYHRLSEQRKLIELWGRKVTDEDFREAYLVGVSYHAMWKEGENPRPQLTRTAFYREVQRLDQEKRLTGRQDDVLTIRASLEKYARRNKLLVKPKTAAANLTQGGKNNKAKNGNGDNKLCYYDKEEPDGCGRLHCSYDHPKHPRPKKLTPAKHKELAARRLAREKNSKQTSQKQANNAETVSEAKEEGKDVDSDEYFSGVTLEGHLATLSDGEDSGEDAVEEYDSSTEYGVNFEVSSADEAVEAVGTSSGAATSVSMLEVDHTLSSGCVDSRSDQASVSVVATKSENLRFRYRHHAHATTKFCDLSLFPRLMGHLVYYLVLLWLCVTAVDGGGVPDISSDFVPPYNDYLYMFHCHDILVSRKLEPVLFRECYPTYLHSFHNTAIKDYGWVLDSGADSHMCNSDELKQGGSEKKVSVRIRTSDKSKVIMATDMFDVKFKQLPNSSLVLHDVVYTPALRKSLMSVSRLADSGMNVVMGTDQAEVRDSNGKLRLVAVRLGGLYYVPSTKSLLLEARELRRIEKRELESTVMTMLSLSVDKKTERQLIHERYGHMSYEMIDKHWPYSTNKQKTCFCEACAATKLIRKPFPKQTNRIIERAGQELHHDWVPETTRGANGEVGSEFIIDRFTHKIFILPLKTAKDIGKAIIMIKRRAEARFGRAVVVVQGDSSSSNKSSEVKDECDRTGTECYWSAPYEKQQNGFCERNIRTWKHVRAAITEHAGMAKVKSFWTYASKQAAYILNVFPRKRSDGTYTCSEELWEGRELDDARVGLFVYGCLCYASVGDIMPKGKRCVYLGTAITEGSKACIVLEIESGKIFTSRNVRADECSFPFRQANSLPKIILTDYIPDEVCVSEEKIEVKIEKRSLFMR